MPDVNSEVIPVASVSSEPDPYAALYDGFLGTGYSTAVELSIIAMVLIAGYVAVCTAGYFISGRDLALKIAETIGLR
jgi:hypothetical protein